MNPTQSVGIDLGTTYSSIAYLNEHGEPITIPNAQGELSTPSVVLIEGYEPIVGTEALRTAVLHPDRILQHAKRFIGNPAKKWVIDGRTFTPVDVSTLILKHLLSAAHEKIGEIDRAVITVPAGFNEAQRLATIEAGHRAGLDRVDIINEPVAAALCHVLGTEGLWFTELADEQRILVFDLGGGTFDLSLVSYSKEEVRVLGSDGDLHLGGLDWNSVLESTIAAQFIKEFKLDPRQDPESKQFLANEAEQTKRSLSSRDKATLTCQHAGHRKSYQIERDKFEKLTKPLVDRTELITKRLLKTLKMGWAHVDTVLTTGGSSRMPMVRERLKALSGRTLNTSLSPDLSIAHGATYYAGMLLSNDKFARSILSTQASDRLARVKQRSVNARPLGLLVRDDDGTLEPHFLIPANTALPAEGQRLVGTISPNQKRVKLQIVEGAQHDENRVTKLGDCVIDGLPEHLPEGTEIAVTIRYDEQARVQVRAKVAVSGQEAAVEILRAENLKAQLTEAQIAGPTARPPAPRTPPAAKPASTPSGPVPQSLQASPAKNPAPRPPIPATAGPKRQDRKDSGEEEFWRTITED